MIYTAPTSGENPGKNQVFSFRLTDMWQAD